MGTVGSLIKPIIFNEGNYNNNTIEEFKKENRIWTINDIYESQLKELFDVRYPNYIFDKEYKKKQIAFLNKRLNIQEAGDWIYFPWNGKMLHILSKDEYFELRTNRNKLLITNAEQQKLRNSNIAFVGLSIGCNIATALSYSGISKCMKLADYDTLATSNLNRVRAAIYEIGLSKIQVTANKIYEIDPYMEFIYYPEGLNSNNINSFFIDKLVPQLIFEACDDFEMKVKIRLEAKKYQVPVVMLTSLGDSLLIDIERYDINKNLKIFNGKVGNVAEEILTKKITDDDKRKYAILLVGKENVPFRAIQTINAIGTTLVGRPQINSTVTIGAGMASYIAKEILLQNSTFSGRRKIVFSDFIR